MTHLDLTWKELIFEEQIVEKISWANLAYMLGDGDKQQYRGKSKFVGGRFTEGGGNMTREILPGIYQLDIPLPNNPLKALKSYLIKGEDRSLLVDTGFNWPECYGAQMDAMEELAIDWNQIDIFVTHLHADHSGLVFVLASESSKIFCSEIDGHIIENASTDEFWERADAFYKSHGYPAEYLKAQRGSFQGAIPSVVKPITYVEEGDKLDYGDYHFACISTPGHTPGHMCLYEPEQKFLIAGDMILSNISSNITARFNVDDALGNYLGSLNKLDAMEISMIFPGHRNIIYDYHQRIVELKEHHKARLEEVLGILKQGPMDGYQVASRMHWDMVYDTWDDVSSYQQWFATGEAVAHLEHLYCLKLLEKKIFEDKIVFQLPSSR